MITGHFAAALALKSYDKSIPLWVLFLGSQLVDIFFMLLLLLGIEHLRIVPDINASNDLDLYYYPFTHSLLITPLWMLGFIGLYFLAKKFSPHKYLAPHKINKSIVVILGLVVASHWLFDLFTHTPDLPLIGDSYKVGFGLWNYPLLSIALEALFIAIGSWLYLRSSNTNTRKKIISVFLLGILLIIPPAINPLLPTPKSHQEVALSGLLMYAIFTLAAYIVDRIK